MSCTIRKYPDAATSCLPLLISLQISVGGGSGTVILKISVLTGALTIPLYKLYSILSYFLKFF